MLHHPQGPPPVAAHCGGSQARSSLVSASQLPTCCTAPALQPYALHAFRAQLLETFGKRGRAQVCCRCLHDWPQAVCRQLAHLSGSFAQLPQAGCPPASWPLQAGKDGMHKAVIAAWRAAPATPLSEAEWREEEALASKVGMPGRGGRGVQTPSGGARH